MLMFSDPGICQDSARAGDALFEKGQFKEALLAYNAYEQIHSDPERLERRGLCHYETNDLSKAIDDFTESKQLGNDSNDLYYYMALCKHAEKSYEEAVFFYKEFLRRLGRKEKNDNYHVYALIKQATHAQFKNSMNPGSFVQNFGKGVNTGYDEIHPVISPTYGNVFYYSSNAVNFSFDIQSKVLSANGDWESNESLPAHLNSVADEMIQDISQNGRYMLMKRTTPKNSGDIFTVPFSDGPLKPRLLKWPFPQMHDVYIVDSCTIIFAADYPGGFGGFDLYKAEFHKGQWSAYKNLGPQINSPFDERSPYLSADYSTIYFSSDRPAGFGGFDIYIADQRSGQWRTPQNIGHPINSVGHDIHFRPGEGGQMAVFSSNRKSGFGGFDLYFAYLKSPVYLKTRHSSTIVFLEEEPGEDKTVNIIENDLETSKSEMITAGHLEDRKEDSPTPSGKKTDQEVLKDAGDNPPPVAGDPEELSETPLPPTEQPSGSKTNTHDGMVKKGIQRSYVLPGTILFMDNHDITSGNNTAHLIKWAEFLNDNPEVKISILGHTSTLEPGLPEFVLYNTLIRTQKVSDFLIHEGVDLEQLDLISYGSGYPLVRALYNDPEDVLDRNKRIDLLIHGEEYFNNGILIESAQTDSLRLDRRHLVFETITDEVYFTVEIASQKTIYKNAILRRYSDVFIRHDLSQDLLHYYVGLYPSLEDAIELRNKLKDSTVPMTRIVPFYRHKPMTEKQINDTPALREALNRID